MSSFRSKSARKSCRNQSESIKFVTSCAGHIEPNETFQRGSRRPFATVDVKKLIFWAAYSVPDLFNCKHKPFISTVLGNANRLLTYIVHSHG